MNILQRIKAGIMAATTATTRDKDGWFVEWAGGVSTASGERVGNDSAMRLSAVYACINAISEDVAKLPLNVYQETDGGKQKMKGHPVYRMLHYQPNPHMTAMTFRQVLTSHCLSWGNAYAEIILDTNKRPAALMPLRPDRVMPMKESGDGLFYRVISDDGAFVDLWPHEVLHIPGLGYDGLVGYNVIQYAREALGHAAALEKHGAAYFGNGATPGGLLVHPNRLSPQARQNLQDFHNREHQGASKANKLTILEEGMQYTKVSIPPNESQFIESRAFSIPEICRWFRIQPHKIADLSRSTYSNIEQQSLDYVTDTLSGWLKRWEQAIWWKLFTDDEKDDGFYAEHVVEGLLRGDINTRYNSYAVGRQWGFLSVNEIRQKENLNPIDGGDQYLVPVNMTTPEKVESMDTEARRQMAGDIADRISSAEFRELGKHVKHAGTPEFTDWLESYYQKHNAYIKKAIAPLGVKVKPERLTLQKQITESQNPGLFIEAAALVHADKIKSTLIEAMNNESECV
jgi:HK97 family phage portal protein